MAAATLKAALAIAMCAAVLLRSSTGQQPTPAPSADCPLYCSSQCTPACQARSADEASNCNSIRLQAVYRECFWGCLSQQIVQQQLGCPQYPWLFCDGSSGSVVGGGGGSGSGGNFGGGRGSGNGGSFGGGSGSGDGSGSFSGGGGSGGGDGSFGDGGSGSSSSCGSCRAPCAWTCCQSCTASVYYPYYKCMWAQAKVFGNCMGICTSDCNGKCVNGSVPYTP